MLVSTPDLFRPILHQMDVQTATADETVKERLLRDITLWQSDGLISGDTAATLRERYGLSRFGLGEVLRYLGIVGLIFLICGILGLVGALAASPIFASVLLLGLGWGFGAAGVVFSHDRLGRYRWSSKITLTIGVFLVSAGLIVLLHTARVPDARLVFVAGWLMLPILIFLAYRYGVTFLLVLGLIGFFHWIGSWTSMWGSSTYVFDVQDPRLMAIASAAVVGVGIWHEQALADRTGRFFVAYESLGLVYLNMSLLILSIEGGYHDAVWIAVMTLVAIGQIVLGARLRNRLILGFGVTFIFIDGFTRFYERFWDSWTKAAFFLGLGLITFGVGAACEFLLRARRNEVSR
jgi:hypothetical protein